MATRTTIFATNDNVTADDLNSLAGVWNTYTPTLGGFTTGNGTATGAYLRYGKLIIYRASFTFGSTSAAASALPTLSLPTTALLASQYVTQHGQFVDVSPGAYYAAFAYLAATTSVSLAIIGTNGLYGQPTTTAPFTWATGDILRASGTYEAA